MNTRNELVVRTDFRRCIATSLRSFLILPAVAGVFMWLYYHDLTTVIRTVAFFVLTEPLILLFRYLSRPTKLRFCGAKLFVTVGKQEQEVYNLRQSDIGLHQTPAQQASDSCDLHLKGASVNAYAHKRGTSVIFGVQDCAAIREYISTHFLP